MFNEKILNWYDKHGKPRPQHIPHGKDDDIKGNLEKMEPISWRQEGNKLIAKTEAGEFVNYIPTDRMFTGVDDNGKPILEKIAPM